MTSTVLVLFFEEYTELPISKKKKKKSFSTILVLQKMHTVMCIKKGIEYVAIGVRVQEVQWVDAFHISPDLDCIMHVKWQDQIFKLIYSVQKKNFNKVVKYLA